MNYVISLYHTDIREKFLNLWQPNNQGYCYSKEWAGLYPEPIDGYHNSDRNMVVAAEILDPLFELGTFIDDELKHRIPNTETVREKLGIKYNNKKELIRIIPYQNQQKQHEYF